MITPSGLVDVGPAVLLTSALSSSAPRARSGASYALSRWLCLPTPLGVCFHGPRISRSPVPALMLDYVLLVSAVRAASQP